MNKYYLRKIFLNLFLVFKNLFVLLLVDDVDSSKWSKNMEKDEVFQKSTKNMAEMDFQLYISSVLLFR